MENSDIQRLYDLASAGSVEASISLCDYLIENKEYKNAFEIMIRLKNTQDKDALKKIATLYEKGIGTDINIELANKYYQLAYENGDVSSGFNLALFYYYKKEYRECLSYLLDGANNNHIQSLKMLAEFYYKGIAVIKDDDVAINFYKKLVSLGDGKSLFNVGIIEFNRKNYDQAFQYLHQASECGDDRALSCLSDCYAMGYGVEQSLEKAINILTIGANKNNKNCLIKLSRYYELGIGVNKNIEYAEELKMKGENIQN